ncbi:hypothetical protein AB0F81_08995 [Actinoplanes sp. NPDC024001]|uniref:hypothetical protein n=1 Tax=Actinoplanes sp. NPDC024001 TaxID=3154598 RepID=UPI00340AAE81
MRYLCAIVAATALSLVTAAAPAQAYENGECINKGGSVSSNTSIYICLKYKGYQVDGDTNHFSLYGGSQFDTESTSATNCKMTVWSTLFAAGTSGTWNSAKVTKSCKWEVDNPGDSLTYLYYSASNTAATHIQVRGCIDLYYNGSSSSGWQRCAATVFYEIA